MTEERFASLPVGERVWHSRRGAVEICDPDEYVPRPEGAKFFRTFGVKSVYVRRIVHRILVEDRSLITDAPP